MNGKLLLHMEDVQKVYREKCVLEDIDLKIREGEFCTIIGPSGCGKSTLFRLILGEERQTAGSLLVDGQPIGHPDETRGIVYQQYSLFPHFTVIQNIRLGLILQAELLQRFTKRRQFQREAAEYLERVDLVEHANKYPHELSGGMQQRVAIAQALITKPKILMMDEPFGALDAMTREAMQVYLLQLWEETKMTILFVTHDLEEAVFLGTRVIVLSQHYHDKRGDGYNNRGARVVADYKLPRDALSTNVKETAEFGRFIQQLRRDIDPSAARCIDHFNLKHTDAFHTTSKELV